MTDEIQAFDVFAAVLQKHQAEVCASFSSRHNRRFDFERLDRASDYRKEKLGRRLIAEYRRGTGEVGAIDWKKFEQWCRDHWKLIVGVKIILTVLMLFCL